MYFFLRKPFAVIDFISEKYINYGVEFPQEKICSLLTFIFVTFHPKLEINLF